MKFLLLSASVFCVVPKKKYNVKVQTKSVRKYFSRKLFKLTEKNRCGEKIE